jgi:hypothetical protein
MAGQSGRWSRSSNRRVLTKSSAGEIVGVDGCLGWAAGWLMACTLAIESGRDILHVVTSKCCPLPGCFDFCAVGRGVFFCCRGEFVQVVREVPARNGIPPQDNKQRAPP